MYGRIHDPGLGRYNPWVRLDLNVVQTASRVGVSTPCGAVSTRGYLHFHPRVIGVAGVREHLFSGDGTLLSPGCGGTSKLSREVQSSPLAGSMSPNQIVAAIVGPHRGPSIKIK